MQFLSQLRVRLTIPFVLIMLLTFVQFSWMLSREVWQLILRAEQQNTALISAAISEYVDGQSSNLNSADALQLLDTVAQITGYKFDLITDDGALIDGDYSTFSAETISAAIEGPQRYVQSDGTPYVIVAEPLSFSDRFATLLVSTSLERSTALLSAIFGELGFAMLVSLLATFFAGWFIARFISTELSSVERMAHAIASGDFAQRVEVKTQDELGRLAATINDMAGQLSDYSESQAQFLGKVSHELRTPLTIIKGFACLMLEDNPVHDEHHPHVIIKHQAEALTRLVDDLLQLTQIDAGTLSLNQQPVEVRPMLQRLATSFGLLGQDDGVRLVLHPTLPTRFSVTADEQRLEQVITILLTNAFKHAPPNSIICLGAALDNSLTIYVEDSGNGVPEADLPYIFDRFYQADKSKAGIGLGLAVARELMLAHGGDISAENRPNGGCRFTISLPTSTPTVLEHASHELDTAMPIPHLSFYSSQRLNH